MKINDKATYNPPSFINPFPIMDTFEDPVFKTKIKQVTDASNTLDPGYGDGRKFQFITPEYSSVTPFNRNSTALLLVQFSYFGLYDGNGNFKRHLLEHGISASSHPRWVNEYSFLYLTGNQLKYYDVELNETFEYHTFKEYQKISMLGEGDISYDGKHIALVGDDKDVFLFDGGNKIKRKKYTFAVPFDQIYVTPHNNVLVGFKVGGTQRFAGLELYDQDMKFIKQITPIAAPHMDVFQKDNGREFVAYAETNQNNAVRVADLHSNEAYDLIKFDWSLAFHIGAARNNWLVVDTYDPHKKDYRNYKTYTNEIIRINYETGEIQRLCHHRSLPLDDYIYQPKATCDWAGDKIVFGSNFGQKPHNYYSDTYLIDLTSEVTQPVPPVIEKPTDIERIVVYNLEDYDVNISNGKLTLKRI